MADKAAPNAMGGLSTREQEILVAALSKCLKNGDIQVDYAKLAAETGLKDAKVASATWSPIKKKLFGIASAQAGTASKVTKPKTPRQRKEPKEPKEPKTPSSTTKKAAKSGVHMEEEQNEAAFDEDTSKVEFKVSSRVNVSNSIDASSALMAEANGNEEPPAKRGEGDSTITDTPEPVEKGKGKTTIIDDISSGDMSPATIAPAPTKAKKAAKPKREATPKTPKTPKTPTGGNFSAAIDDAAGTPVPGSSGANKRGRKTKAQKEAEAATTGENGTTEAGEDDEAEKPAKRPRKTPTKKAKKEDVAGDGEPAGAGEGGAGAKETPTKTPRKAHVKKPKKEKCAEGEGVADSDVENGEDGEKEKPVKKPRKTPAKKERKKKEGAVLNGESSPAGEAVKEKMPGSKLGADKAEKAVTPADSGEDVGEEEEQEKIRHGASAKVGENATLANDALDSKNVETKAISTTDATLPPRNWGTPVNGDSPSPTKAQVVVQPGKEYGTASGIINGEGDRDTVFIGSEVMQSIETEDDEAGATTAVASA